MTMPRARRELVCPQTTPYYHCITRCVRRAFLCGLDRLTGRSYEHRKQWIVERLAVLGELFAIDICAYAVMSNHLHVVVRLDPERAASWSREQVLERWTGLFSLPLLAERYRAGDALGKAELAQLDTFVSVYRNRLADLSWFMRCLNEPIARQANAEDNCTGRFWEGRFISQALLDEAALLTCMAYVDLNPIRAGLADTPEDSDFTAIQQRIRQWHAGARQDAGTADEAVSADDALRATLPRLFGFIETKRSEQPDGLPFTWHDYLQLVDWTGRAVIEGKRGSGPDAAPPVLQRLGIAQEAWLQHCGGRKLRFRDVIGRAESVRAAAQQLGRCFLKGVTPARVLFPKPG